ncbi:hypothetical protein PC121_g15312 [Phytophthora cactorum]|nr:hypothetical protein PC121_g15312 [Phytophthora cactorum]
MSVTKALGSMTPYQKLNKRKPDLEDIKICGCVAYHQLPKARQGNKLEMRAKPAVFLRIADSSLGYRLLDLETGDIIQRRSVRFREDVAVGGNYLEHLLAKRDNGKPTTVLNEIPYVLLPVTHVAVRDVERVDDLGGKPLVPSTAHTQDAGSSSSDESDWDYIEGVGAQDDGGVCSRMNVRVEPIGVLEPGEGVNLQNVATSGSLSESRRVSPTRPVGDNDSERRDQGASCRRSITQQIQSGPDAV